MPQLDKLLAHITPRGGLRLRLEPNAPPVLVMAAGNETPLLTNSLPPTMIEVLAKEVVPTAREGQLRTTGEVLFDHEAGGETFRILVSRGPAGFTISAEPALGPTATQPLPRQTELAPAQARPAQVRLAEAKPSAGPTPPPPAEPPPAPRPPPLL
jgi:hypothetical protein